MSGSQTSRGHPLVALLAILVGWIGGRVVNWEAPMLTGAAAAVQGSGRAAGTAIGFIIDDRAGPQSLPNAFSPVYSSVYPYTYVPYGPGYPGGLAAAGTMLSGRRPVAPLALWDPAGSDWGPSAWGLMPPSGRGVTPPQGARRSIPRFLAPETASASASAAPRAVAPVPMPPSLRPRRWSFDSWALLRRDGAGPMSVGLGPATYGASQSGAMLRYRVDLSSRYQPTVFARTTTALAQERENSAALGFSARPLPSVPLVAAVEGRMTDQAGGTRFQPAAYVYTQLPPVSLSRELQAEAYFQGGYVGGKFATPFADGQVRLDRKMVRIGSIDGRIGAGAWGGAQKGAARLDIGPSALVTMPLGKRMFGRVSLDWRFRVAGNAQPDSGPAMTLSAGF
jgi:hypothetical protein